MKSLMRIKEETGSKPGAAELSIKEWGINNYGGLFLFYLGLDFQQVYLLDQALQGTKGQKLLVRSDVRNPCGPKFSHKFALVKNPYYHQQKSAEMCISSDILHHLRGLY